MAIAAGSRLGPYEIVSRLGAGGMGEVYRARDTKLGRDVEAGVPRVLFEMPLPESDPGDPSRYAVTPDGKRFLVLTTAADAATLPAPPITIVEHWQQMSLR